MYKISVPIQAHTIVKDPEGSIRELNRFNPDRVFISCDHAFGPDSEKVQRDVENIKWRMGSCIYDMLLSATIFDFLFRRCMG